VATQVRTIFDQADAAAVHAQFDRVVAALASKYPQAAEHLEAAREERGCCICGGRGRAGCAALLH
jgi:putative transposase